LGLDSLLLTQAAQLIQRKFKVQITFRQLMEELSSLDAIASHVDATLPPEVHPQERMMPAEVPQPAQGSSALAGTTPLSVLEQILHQQQQLTNQVLQLMGRQSSVPPASIPSVTVSAQATAGGPLLPSKPEGKSHGPFKPFDKNASTALPEGQKRVLDALIARYIGRTAGSKKLVAENRANLADPRSVAGFNRLWKEMVYPIVSTRSDGSKVWDVDGNEYVDFVMGFGASLFGHRPPFVVKAVHEQLDLGFEIGPIQPLAYEVAALMKEFTGMDRVGFTNTGSESVLAAMRMTRTISGRDKIAVFAGAYHGIFDEVLFRPLTVNGEMRTAAIAPGIPGTALAQIIVLDYGNPQSLEILRSRGSEIAAVFVEPVQSRRLDLQPKEFLHELRRITGETGMALVFDEVVTGFRVHPGGAQAHFGVRADIATYGKVIGGGLPIGMVAGDKRYLDVLDGGHWQYGDASFPEVGVTFFAGTCVRHPLALAAAKSVLTHLKQSGPQLQKRLADRTAKLADELRTVIKEFHAPYHVAQFSSLMTLTFPPDQKLAGLLFYLLRERGILIWENRNFIITTAHTETDLAKLIKAFRESLADMRSGGFFPGSVDEAIKSSGASAVETSDRIERPAGTTVAGLSLNGFPLTEAQKEIWLAAQMGGDAAVAYNESLTLKFRGALDVAVFRTAVYQVVGRHPIVLASISEDGLLQRLPAEQKIEIPLDDLSNLHEQVQGRQLTEIVEQETNGPFDLSAGPLLRVRVVKLSSDHHIVLWTAHHIVCDGWSSGLLVSELAKVYSSLKQGATPALESPVPFYEYVQLAQPESPAAQGALTYWHQQFSVVPLPLDLPTDRPRPRVRSAKAATYTRKFDYSLHQSLRRMAGQQRTTMVVLLMAAMKTLLHRLTGQTDLVIGLPLAGQAVTGRHCLVGHCVNLLPVRSQMQPDASFLDNLVSVKKNVLDAYDHHQCTIGTILQHIQVPRNAGRPPLVEVIFNVDRDLNTTDFAELSFECERNQKRALHYDFFFNFTEGPRGLFVDCDYNTDLFDETTIERWFERYQVLLETIIAKPTEGLGTLSMLTSGEREDLITLGNSPRTAIPPYTLSEWFEIQAGKSPDDCAVICEGRQLAYGELNRRANQLARHLQSLGVGPNNLVGLMVERSVDMMVALLAVLKAGGAYVPLDPSFPQGRLNYMVENSGMRVLVTHRNLVQQLSVKPVSIVRLDDDSPAFARQAGDNICAPKLSAENLAYVLYTSGSTGKPKGVEVQHSALVNFLDSMQREPGFRNTDTMLAVTTLSFDIAGLELYLPLVTGGKLVIASRDEAQDPIRLIERMRESDCTMMQATPATWRALLHVGWKGSPRLKILCGGESFPRDLAQELLPHCAELWNMYGPTETTIWSTIYRVWETDGPIPIGRPIANTQVFVLDVHRNLVPHGVIGELYIGGDGLARGYLCRPELTEERFVPSPLATNDRLYRTGDLARWLHDGALECLGRIDGQVKIRGYRIELGEVETVLVQHTAIRQGVVTAYEQSPGSKVLVAYCQAHTGMTPVVSDLRAHLKKSLPEYMVPSIFVTMDTLPLTPNGKIDRKALPSPREKQIESFVEFVGPRDPLEQTLANIWSKILKVVRVGLYDNFFDLGGHSLGAVSMLLDVKKLTGRTLPLATLFQAPTIAALAELLRREGWNPSWSSLVPIRSQGARTPLFLVHGAEGNVMLYRHLAQHLDADRPIYGLQSHGLDGKNSPDRTIKEMASRYLKEVVALQPKGPYLVGGYCLGGTIALELAQQLTSVGEKVDLVILLETYNPSLVSRKMAQLLSPLHKLQNLWFHAANVASLADKDRHRFLTEKLDTEWTRLSIRLQAILHLFSGVDKQDEAASYPHLKIKQANDQANFDYVPQPYKGRVMVIRPKGCFVGETDPSLGWNNIVPNGLEIHDLPVYPRGILIEPFCRVLAKSLKLCLEKM
jgi:amino acid adenylation domain-containing protein